MKLRWTMVLVLLLVSLVWGCAEELPPAEGITKGLFLDSEDGPFADHEGPWEVVHLDERALMEVGPGEAVRLSPGRAFRQAAVMVTADAVEDLAYRVLDSEGRWSAWEPVEVHLSVRRIHNGLIFPEEPAVALELRGARGLTDLYSEFSAIRTAPSELALRDGVDGEDDVAEVRQAVAPSDMVISRHEWGAYDPDRICNSFFAPYRATVHHTAGQNNETDPYARMVAIQDFHLNGRGWCDIGYHFVVAPTGEIFQGRSRSDHPGAHVGGENEGNVGISTMGNYVDAQPPQVMLDSVVRMLQWVRDTHGVPMNRDVVRGHGEWESAATACPGTNILIRLDEMVAQAGGPTPEPVEYSVELVVESDLGDFYTQGSSEGVADAVVGEEFEAVVRISNRSPEPLRGVRLGLDFGDDEVVVTDYRIETDAPDFDLSSWTLNDADEAPENPARDEVVSGTELTLYAFAAGETKRVVLSLRAQEYLGADREFGGVRAWMVNIDEVYAQVGPGEEADPNRVGYPLEASEVVDVVSPWKWQFPARTAAELEGWTTGGAVEEAQASPEQGVIGVETTAMGYLEAPSWTWVEADRKGELVMRARVVEGAAGMGVFWTYPGQNYSSGRSARFGLPADGEWHRVVVPIGKHAGWGGEVRDLRLVFDPDSSGGGVYEIDYLYFQESGASGESPVEVSFPGGPVPPTGITRMTPVGDGVTVKGNAGCAAVGVVGGESLSGGRSGWLLVLLVGVLIRRCGRRRRERGSQSGCEVRRTEA